MAHHQTRRASFLFTALCASTLAACGGGGGSDSTTSSLDASTVYPSGLSVVSPVTMSVGTDTLASLRVSPFAILKETLLASLHGDYKSAVRTAGRLLPISDAWAATYVPSYIAAANRINALLNGSATARTTTVFNATRFLSSPVDAGCYGPQLLYQGHPDGTPANGTLPSGDLGMWSTTDTSTGHVCAAAQLDARMDSITQRTSMGLMTLASLINVASTAGKSLPAAGSSLTLTSDMNSTFTTMTFTSATVAQSSAGVWTYTVQFTFIDASLLSHNAEIKLTHTPGTSRTSYTGLLTYAVTRGTVNMLNCPAISGGTVDVGTLQYTRSGSTSVTIVQREGNYCGTGTASNLAASVATLKSDGQLDPTATWNGTRGWANNFNRFGAVYDPTTLAGNYALGWQAGSQDGNSRIFNIGLNYNSTTTVRDGEAYFGYGTDITTSDGKIQGFICNWAGPGNSHTLKDFYQRQNISFNDTTGKWGLSLGAASSSNITYAPTNTCINTGSTFLYDRNLNSVLGDDTVTVTTPDLQGKGTSATIPLAITARGMVTPSF